MSCSLANSAFCKYMFFYGFYAFCIQADENIKTSFANLTNYEHYLVSISGVDYQLILRNKFIFPFQFVDAKLLCYKKTGRPPMAEMRYVLWNLLATWEILTSHNTISYTISTWKMLLCWCKIENSRVPVRACISVLITGAYLLVLSSAAYNMWIVLNNARACTRPWVLACLQSVLNN